MKSLYERHPRLPRRGPRLAIMQMNLEAVDHAREHGFHLMAFWLMHAAMEANLRASLRNHSRETGFSELIEELQASHRRFRGKARLVRDLKTANNFRNRTVHELWTDAYEHVNEQARRRHRQLFAILRRVLKELVTVAK